ncbi:type I-E CRISPR-associated protein Cas5/CasD [Quadrisphaera sp. DSM 44207]|uniref:type I-E CRISPR-associated protein Cas5/CasD n=1 Tax=Quadrisphaera sp. DSM 44207 TaxID=1881057 RepID=UPI000881443C|nr:type I-E CRISPR-associated protein Cas5/CasD [Quadrisphaera sp. DSM 44207]SDQ52525.1 CRISPR-associated protein, Cas5e family [Quadrisphaera sp. DSM 44207]
MSVLLLRLAAPLQSWGAASRFVRRETRHEPTKSGVLGLLAAAEGRRRTDPVEDLARTSFGVRVDQPGRLVRDFQTARSLDGTRTMPLSYRFYLADAVFLAGVEGGPSLLHGLDEALRAPVFPLFLGRRSCPPSGQVSLGVREGGLQEVLQGEPWQAALWWRKRQGPRLDLPIVRDAADPAEPGDLVRDQPISYDPERREYGWRTVVHGEPARITNTDAAPGARSRVDFLAALGGA